MEEGFVGVEVEVGGEVFHPASEAAEGLLDALREGAVLAFALVDGGDDVGG